MNINEFQPTSGRFVKEDGTTVNIADELGGKSVSDKVYDINNMMPHSGRFIKEDGTTVNIADMIANGDIGGGSDSGSSDDSAPPIIETYNGQVIQCSMSADRPVKGLNLYATCEQQTYSGKNLFNKDAIEDGMVNASGQLGSVETVKTSDFIKVKPSTQYKSSFNSAYVKFYTSEKEPVQTENVDIIVNSQKFTTGESTEYIRYSFNFQVQTPETLIIVEGTNELAPYEPYTGGIPSPSGDYPQEIQTISDFVVEVKNSMGATATPQTLNITIPEQGFFGIPIDPKETSINPDGNYTDAGGTKWICDEIDFAKKKFIKRTKMIELTGKETVGEWTLTTEEQKTTFRYRLTNERPPSAQMPCVSNRAINNLSGEPWTINTNVYSIWIRTPTSINTMQLLQEYLEENSFKVLYVLDDPIEYDLSDEQIKQFQQLKSYYGTTYIDNDAVPACNMEAELILDTKLYIDDKLSS